MVVGLIWSQVVVPAVAAAAAAVAPIMVVLPPVVAEEEGELMEAIMAGTNIQRPLGSIRGDPVQ